MPFPFVLPTTSSFSFSSSFSCDSHPSLPLSASTYRGVVRDALKKHKRLPPSSQTSNLRTVISSLEQYLPYLLAIDAGLSNQPVGGEAVSTILETTPSISWRPTLSGDIVPGRERPRVKIFSIEHEIYFTLSTLGFAHVLMARATLQPLYSTTTEFQGTQERTTALTMGTKYLLKSASIYNYIAARSEQVASNPPCADISPATLRALASLCHAEATLLAVLKDDPYPAAVAQERNKNDKEWMFKAPDIPKVRAHLYARLCLAASEHAAKAAALCQSAKSGSTGISSGFLRYLEDLRRTSRAKACRFFGIDAELGGEAAEGIAWARAGLHELGVEVKDEKKGLGFSRAIKGLSEKREDRRVDKEAAWGADAGKSEETRVLGMLDAKWNKINDTMNTRPIPPIGALINKMPSGREIHTVKPYQPPVLDREVLEAMRAPPDQAEDVGGEASSDDETLVEGSASTAGGAPRGSYY
ncbi:pH-response regulator protein palC [Trichoderma asperellum]|uniref:pH-response regulator protein palC n=1 Tax=Trichoderma asperellum TaxID=101201 RepID=A0A6V8RA51_TRIAP|nr:pH-response regulator protein palC [Trichoderma asperellum]